MRTRYLILITVLFSMLAMRPAVQTRIIFFGDSITQAGVNKGGYIDRIQSAINSRSLQQEFELMGAGIGGNKVYDLFLRMDDDVLAKNPQLVVIYVGINDVWHKTTHGTGTDPDKFEKFYTAIIKKMQARNIKVAICTPSVIGELKNNGNPQDTDLNSYSDIIRRLAVAHQCTLFDLRKGFEKY